MPKRKERACWIRDERRQKPGLIRFGRQRHRNGPVITVKPATKSPRQG